MPSGEIHQPDERQEPRRPRRFAARRAAGAAARGIAVLGLVALVAAPETTLVWTWTEPQWMLRVVDGNSGRVFTTLRTVDEDVLTMPSFIFPTDVGAPRRLGVGIQSTHAVQRNADIDPDQIARAWRRLRGGAASTQAADWWVFGKIPLFR